MIKEYIFETEWEATDFAEESGKNFIKYSGSSWRTCDDGDYGVIVKE